MSAVASGGIDNTVATAESTKSSALNVAPGSVVRVRDEDWLVTKVEPTRSGMLVHGYGLTELVRDTEAAFYEDLDEIEIVDPRNARIVADDSPRYRRARLFVETTLRKTPEPATTNRLTVSPRMLATQLDYQRLAVAQALSPENIRPRILIADAVGLGKTLEIGMILSELVARGRGDNILIVTPKHVLEQMQHEMWCRFALPFVRLDSTGIQRVRRTIPATRNPFSYYKRAIISIDTLKTPRYREHLKKRRWDAVVIDESHNVTNAGTQNNELARLLAARTDALILASATPHNGNEKAFAELLRLLDPTVVAPDGTIIQEAASKLIIRRHRYSPEVAQEVGSDWARRLEPINIPVHATAEENAVASELSRVWLHNPDGCPAHHHLFSWTLAKAFLSSPAALVETIENRLRSASAPEPGERAALERLLGLAQAADSTKSAKFVGLVQYLKELGVGRRSTRRAVVFSERIATLHFLHDNLPKALGLQKGQVAVLHGGLTDVEQQAVVEEFKRGSSDVRVLVTGDVASEGVNLHAECHNLIHYDIPWSLIRIEQRNGRIDRYGQKHPPQIASLMLVPEDPDFSGDIRVLSSLLTKEHAAHQVFSDVACVMGKYSETAEEKLITEVLQGKKSLDEAVPDPDELTLDSLETLLAGLDDDNGESKGAEDDADERPVTAEVAPDVSLFASDADLLDQAIREAFADPAKEINWQVHDGVLATLTPTPDLRRRLTALPQGYLKERNVLEDMRLALVPDQATQSLEEARASQETTWPQVHYLSPLHPVLDWAVDRALASISRDDVLAVRGDVDGPEFLMLGAITNRRGQLLTRTFLVLRIVGHCIYEDVSAYMTQIGVDGTRANPYPVSTEKLQDLLPNMVDRAQEYMESFKGDLLAESTHQLEEWVQRADRWSQEADSLIQRAELKKRKERVREERELATMMTPQQVIVRPLLAVVPKEGEY